MLPIIVIAIAAIVFVLRRMIFVVHIGGNGGGFGRGLLVLLALAAVWYWANGGF